MPQVDRSTPIVQAHVDLMNANKVALGLQAVFYGDQKLIPSYPSVTVEGGPVSRELSGLGGKGRTTNIIQVYYMIYNAKLADIQATRKAADQLAESIMDTIHTDMTLGGRVIHGFVKAIEPGYVTRGADLLFASRLTWEGKTKTLIV